MLQTVAACPLILHKCFFVSISNMFYYEANSVCLVRHFFKANLAQKP